MRNLISKIWILFVLPGVAVADDCTYFCDSKEIKAIKENLKNEETNELLRQSIKLQQQQIELERQQQVQEQEFRDTIEEEFSRVEASRSERGNSR